MAVSEPSWILLLRVVANFWERKNVLLQMTNSSCWNMFNLSFHIWSRGLNSFFVFVTCMLATCIVFFVHSQIFFLRDFFTWNFTFCTVFCTRFFCLIFYRIFHNNTNNIHILHSFFYKNNFIITMSLKMAKK